MTTTLPIAPADAPIACTLGAGEYADRTGWIAALNRTALRSHRQDGLALQLVYEPAAAPKVRDLVAQEQVCCAFLAFRVDEAPDAVRLTVVAPAGAREALDAVFAPFLSGVPNATPHPHADTDRDPARDVAAASGPPSGSRAPGLAAGTAAVAALACGVCCVLPFALPAVALAAVGGALAAFARVYWWALGAAVVAVAAAWGWVGWQSARSGRRPAPSTLRAMALATLLLGAAASWSYVEPLVKRALQG